MGVSSLDFQGRSAALSFCLFSGEYILSAGIAGKEWRLTLLIAKPLLNNKFKCEE
jgi:hypothetical protein